VLISPIHLKCKYWSSTNTKTEQNKNGICSNFGSNWHKGYFFTGIIP